ATGGVMPNAIKRALEAALAGGACHIGEIAIWPAKGGFALSHRDDKQLKECQVSGNAQDALEIAKLDDAGNYRPLKTAPNLRHGWRLEMATLNEVGRALDYLYPGRLAIFAAWKGEQLKTKTLR